MNEGIENIFLLILFLIIGFYLPVKFGQHEAEIDYEKIIFDGSRNSLNKIFHKQNFIKRFFVGLAVSFVLNYLLNLIANFSWWFFLPYLFYFGAAFNFEFTQTLNKKRGLHQWYVSSSPTASNYDKYIISLAKKNNIPPYTVNKNINENFLIVASLILIGFILIEIFK